MLATAMGFNVGKKIKLISRKYPLHVNAVENFSDDTMSMKQNLNILVDASRRYVVKFNACLCKTTPNLILTIAIAYRLDRVWKEATFRFPYKL